MSNDLYRELHTEGLISEESLHRLQQPMVRAPLSVFWEVRTLLYLGVLMLTGGLGLLVYENIDTIGHTAVLILIGVIAAGSLFYCFKKAPAYNREKTVAPNSLFDYMVLLGSLSLLSFISYWQYQYKILGTDYGLATFIPMVFLFFAAYRFDHLGILTMAIANLAVWMGVSVTPKELLLSFDFDKSSLVHIYLMLGVLLVLMAIASAKYNLKKHFKFTYQHYGVHVLYIALLSGYFHFYDTFWAALYMLALYGFSIFVYNDAIKSRSFYFLLLMTLYTYVALSAIVVRAMAAMPGDAILSLGFFYFIASGTGLIFLLIHFNRKVRAV